MRETTSATNVNAIFIFLDIWYNKWAGGDREDSYSKCVLNSRYSVFSNQSYAYLAKPNPKLDAASNATLGSHALTPRG